MKVAFIAIHMCVCYNGGYFDLFVLFLKRDRLDSTDTRVLEGDLLDDVLTAPSAAPPRRSSITTNEDEVRGCTRCGE